MKTGGMKVLRETRCRRPEGIKGEVANGGHGSVGRAVDKSMRKKKIGDGEAEEVTRK